MEQKYHISFIYRDADSRGVWNIQQCTLYADSEREASAKCVKLYGLGVDCDYEIVLVEKVGG